MDECFLFNAELNKQMINVNSGTDERLIALVYGMMHAIHRCKAALLQLVIEMHSSIRSCFVHKCEARNAKRKLKKKTKQNINKSFMLYQI